MTKISLSSFSISLSNYLTFSLIQIVIILIFIYGKYRSSFFIFFPADPILSWFLKAKKPNQSSMISFHVLVYALMVRAASGFYCAADYGTDIGGNVCCGQPYTITNKQQVCPKFKPTCYNYIHNLQWGECVIAAVSKIKVYQACAASSGRVGDHVCCGQTGKITAPWQVCPFLQVCDGYERNKKWGTCREGWESRR